uniref:Uncharacterized protein n=1 Tax=Lepeophtheirus salmonis TaxID=72036 RepID=A0A0K2TFA8_LEPSM
MNRSRAHVKRTFRAKHPAQVMVLGVVASDGSKMATYFFKANEKVDMDTYYKVLRYPILPWLKSTFPGDNYVLTKTAPPHTRPRRCNISARRTCVPSGRPDFRPLSSPDVNPLDFAVWCFLERKTNKTSQQNV